MDEKPQPADGSLPETSARAAQVATTARTDDELRRFAVERLIDHLEIGASLVERCERLAFARRGDRVGPMHAAARLMQANAKVADALAHVAQIERRRRSIIERIQPVQVDKTKLIQKNWEEKKAERQRRIRSIEEKLDRVREAELAEGINPYREGTNRAREWDDAREAYLQRQSA
jgi:hypothetical protein